MEKDSKFRSFLFILIAGMGNVKRGKWYGIFIYFSAIILLGTGLVYVEQRIEQYYQPSQTMRIFLILVYIAFAFFWDGTIFLGSDKKSNYFGHDEGILAKNNPRETQNNSKI